MGVKNLWDILESCKQTLPLHHLQNKRVCVDLSCWIVQLQNTCKASFTKEKVYLKNLFHRLRALIALNCTVVFVADGSIPAIKLAAYRRRLGSGSEAHRDERNIQRASSLPRNMGSDFSCMIKEAKLLGLSLGVPCLDGLEEAEAQCALLNSESLCDGCFTSDSDVFLFGARTVYRDIYLGDGGYVVCYEMVDIERKLGFGRNSLISLALLLGSDYSNGVHGLGPETACQVIKSIGDGMVLHQIVSEGLEYLKKGRGTKKRRSTLRSNIGKESSSDIKQEIGDDHASKQVAVSIDQFLQVTTAYLKPKCHSPDSEAVQRMINKNSNFVVDEYVLPKIAERDLRRFANLRHTSSEAGVHMPLDKMPVKCPVTAIVKNRKLNGKDYFEVLWQGLNGLQSSVVPADLVESAFPEKIAEFM